MEPWEVMTSESQERMLAIVTPESWPAVAAICAKWEVRATVIGTVTEPEPGGGGRLRIRDGFDGPVLADVPAASLSDDAPLYDRPRRRRRRSAAAPPGAARPTAPADLLALLRSPRWVYRQYDHQLFLNTVAGPGADAALLRLAGPGLPPSDRGVALTTDSNPAACALDPRRGTALVLAEGVANLACVGRDAGRGGQLPELRQPRAPRGHVAAVRVHRRHGRGLPGARPPGHRRQRQLLQRERRGRHRPHAGARRARPRRRGARAAARAGLVRRRRPRAAGRRAPRPTGAFPLEGTRWATERRDHRSGRMPGRRLRGARRGLCLRGRPGGGAGGRQAPARRWCTPCTTCRRADWPWRWPRWPSRPGSGARVDARATRPSSSPSCPSRFVVATGDARRAVRPGRGARRPGRRAGPGRRRPGHAWALIDLPVEALRRGPRGEPRPGPGRTVTPLACARMADA